MQHDGVVYRKSGGSTQNKYTTLSSHHKLSFIVFYYIILDCSMPFDTIIDENIKSLCCMLSLMDL